MVNFARIPGGSALGENCYRARCYNFELLGIRRLYSSTKVIIFLPLSLSGSEPAEHLVLIPALPTPREGP